MSIHSTARPAPRRVRFTPPTPVHSTDHMGVDELDALAKVNQAPHVVELAFYGAHPRHVVLVCNNLYLAIVEAYRHSMADGVDVIAVRPATPDEGRLIEGTSNRHTVLSSDGWY